MRNNVVSAVIVGVLIAAIILMMTLIPIVGANQILVDFDAFYIVGQLYWQSDIAAAYSLPEMAALQRELVGHEGFMPWTYPPQFDLLTIVLPLMSRSVAYGLFISTTLFAYLYVLWRLARNAFSYTLVALFPPILVAVLIGQNGFLTGALMGAYCLFARQGSYTAGWALGALSIKPHLGIGLGIHALFRKDWPSLLIALFVAAASSAVATLVFGPNLWLVFLEGVEGSSGLLQAGFYPLFRMMSVYALLHTLGVPPSFALWGQIGVAVLVLAIIAWLTMRQLPSHQVLGLSCLLSVLVSPYIYDYDLTIAGIGLALLAKDILIRASIVEKALMLLLLWVAGGWGMFHAIGLAGMPWEARAEVARSTVAYGAFAFLVVLVMISRVLSRATPASVST